MEEFLEEEAGEAARVVANDAVFLEEIVEDDAEAEFLKCKKIDGHGLGALSTVAPGNVWRNGLAIGNHPIDHALRDVRLNGAEMIGESVAGGFAGLGHEIGYVNARSFGFGDGAGNFWNQEIGQDAGIERAGAKKNEVGMLDGFNGPGKRANAAWRKHKFLDRHAAGSDARFAVDGAAALQCGNEVNVRKR